MHSYSHEKNIHVISKSTSRAVNYAYCEKSMPKQKKAVSLDDLCKSLSAALRRLQGLSQEHRQLTDPQDREQRILEISGKLRPLIATGSQEIQMPLLQHLACEAQCKLYIFSDKTRPDISEDEANKLVSFVHAGRTWSSGGSQTEKMTFDDWLDSDIYYSDEDSRWCSRKKIIKDFANSMGASHFGNKIPFVVDSLQRTFYGDSVTPQSMSGIEQTILDIAEATFWVGSNFLLRLKIKETALGRIKTKNKALEIKRLKSELTALDKRFDANTAPGPKFSVALFGQDA